MIFCQMKVRVKLPVTETLYLDQAATVRTDKPLQLHIPLTCPQKVGVWSLEAADAALGVAAGLSAGKRHDAGAGHLLCASHCR